MKKFEFVFFSSEMHVPHGTKNEAEEAQNDQADDEFDDEDPEIEADEEGIYTQIRSYY